MSPSFSFGAINGLLKFNNSLVVHQVLLGRLIVPPEIKPRILKLKMISSLYCAVSAPQCLSVSLGGMRIDAINYELLTLSFRQFKFFFQQFL